MDDSWAFGNSIPMERRGLGVAVVNDRLYIIGGYTETYPASISNYVTPYASNEQYTPFDYGTVPSAVNVVSPENKNYTSSNVPLVFTVNKPALWTGYNLDGQENVTVAGNTTIAGLTTGLHNVTVYVKDEFENIGGSETIYFTITKEPEPFPATIVAAATVSVITIAAVLIIYFKKRYG